MAALDPAALDQIFLEARSFNRFTDRPVTDATLRQIYDLMKWGPTSFNCQPARFVFLRSPAARERLRPALSPGNVEKTMAAPLTVIVAFDLRFHDFLPEQYPRLEAKAIFDADPARAEITALRNGTLQGAYFIIAARTLGLDCGPMSGFDNAKVDAEFFPGSSWKSNFLVNLGFGDPTGNYPRGPRLLFEAASRIV